MTGPQLLQAAVGGTGIALGVVLFLIAALGLLRFPDPFSRLTAVTKSGTLGICLVLLGVLVLAPTPANLVKVLLAVALQLITSPVAGFALSRASFRADAPLPPGMQYDELHGADESGPLRPHPGDAGPVRPPR